MWWEISRIKHNFESLDILVMRRCQNFRHLCVTILFSDTFWRWRYCPMTSSAASPGTSSAVKLPKIIDIKIITRTADQNCLIRLSPADNDNQSMSWRLPAPAIELSESVGELLPSSFIAASMSTHLKAASPAAFSISPSLLIVLLRTATRHGPFLFHVYP